MQVMKAGVDGAQRRRMGENGLLVAMDPRSQRLLRHEEVPCRLPHCYKRLALELPALLLVQPSSHSLLHPSSLESLDRRRDSISVGPVAKYMLSLSHARQFLQLAVVQGSGPQLHV